MAAPLASLRSMLRAPLLAGVLAAPALPAQQSQPRPPTIPELEAQAVRDSNDATVHYQLAMAYWDRKRWDDAERALQTALLVAPSYAEAHLALGVLPERRGEGYWKRRVKERGESDVVAELLRAEQHYRKAFLLNPLVDLRVVGKFEQERGDFYVMQRGGRLFFWVVPWWNRELVKGMNEFREGKYERAGQRFAELAANRRFSGQDVDLPGIILWYQGLTAAHLGSFEQAARNLAILTGRAVAAENDSTAPPSQIPLGANHYRFLTATLLYLGGRHDQAIPVFRRTLEFDLSLYEAHVQMARMYDVAGQPEQGLAERRMALDVNPEDPDLLADYAGALIRLGRLAEAQAPLAEAASYNPRDARVPYLRGLVAESLGQAAEARAALERFLALAPSRFAGERSDAQQRLARLP
ncbi:MAG: tetratricopeptide repeat protein [Gemmatimonadales bacterium]